MRNPPRRRPSSRPERVPEGKWVYMSTPRTYWAAPYGGVVGQLIAVLVIIAALVLWMTNQMDGQTAVMFGALGLARLL